MEPTLLILQGPPGSGKTTRAGEWLAEGDHRVRVCRDDIRDMFRGGEDHGGLLTTAEEWIVSATEGCAVLSALTAGHDVVVDATNANTGRWRDVASMNGAVLVIERMPTSVEECISRVEARGATGGRRVSSSIIRAIAADIAAENREAALAACVETDRGADLRAMETARTEGSR